METKGFLGFAGGGEWGSEILKPKDFGGDF